MRDQLTHHVSRVHISISPSKRPSKACTADREPYFRGLTSAGHTASWGRGYPDLLAECFDEAGQRTGAGPLDPTQNGTYGALWRLLREAAGLFPDAYVHLGGDEIDLACWEVRDAPCSLDHGRGDQEPSGEMIALNKASFMEAQTNVRSRPVMLQTSEQPSRYRCLPLTYCMTQLTLTCTANSHVWALVCHSVCIRSQYRAFWKKPAPGLVGLTGMD